MVENTANREIIVADIGGTHARFAIAVIAGDHLDSLTHQRTLLTADHASLQIAWEDYARQIDRELPNEGAIAAAAHVDGDVMTFTNSSWMLRPAMVSDKLGLDRFVIVNDFGAVAYACAQVPDDDLVHICGPEAHMIRSDNMVSVIGPGTGLGVASLSWHKGEYFVIETEGGHIDFAPHDAVEDRILAALRTEHGRVSVERIVAGPGLKTIYRVLAELEGKMPQDLDDKALWTLALSGEDSLSAAAFDRYCLCLGSVVGDLALAQGANMVVMAGGLGARIGDRFGQSGFRERFVAKGRFRSLMENISVKRLICNEPGLQGAAAAFIHRYLQSE